MSGLTVRKDRQDAVRAAMRQERCLVDGCSNAPHTRGLCHAHKTDFYGELKRLTPEERAEFEAKCIRAGLVLEPYTARRRNRVNVFADLV